MKKILVLAIVVTVFGAAPAVFAHEGHDHGATTVAQQELAREQAEKIADQSRKANIESAQRKANDDAKVFTGELRQRVKEHTQQERAKNCEDRKTGLQTKLANLQKNARSFMTKINNVYSAAQTFMTKNQLSSDTLSTQIIAADAAQSEAEIAVSALEGLTVTIDCNSTSVADQVAGFRVAAEKARSALHMYKQAVKDVLTTLRELKEAA